MLKVMRRIIQEMKAAASLEEALRVVVRRIREAVETEACTIYLLDHENQDLLLMASAGLSLDENDPIRIPAGLGLVGLVVERGEPVNVDDANVHERFYPLQGIGEERYKAFLGVPIVAHRRTLGVLVVQQQEQRRFDEAEEAFLITMSAQLATVIAKADLAGDAQTLFTESKKLAQPAFLDGVPTVSGVAIGTAVMVYPLADLEAVPNKTCDDPEADIALFNAALEAVRDDINSLSERAQATLPVREQALFDVYLKVLSSQSLIDDVCARIREGLWAQAALKHVILQYIQKFNAMADPYLQERAMDIRDLGQRILQYLQKSQPTSRVEYPAKTILIGHEIPASALLEVPENQLVAVVSSTGSGNSHIAILARAMGVPAVMGVQRFPADALDTMELIVNGYNGRVYVAPSKALRQEFSLLVAEERQLDEELEDLQRLPAQTSDGHRVNLYVNTGLVADVQRSLGVGAEGVGLYRSEVAFFTREGFPSEEEQRILYRQLLSVFAPRPVVMRTLDVGGDKMLPYFPINEPNPFLGWRGIRITLDHPELFLVQVRAMLRANEGLNNLRIMLPMISSVTEADEALRLMRQAYRELLEEGYDCPFPPIGAMVEVPSAVAQSAALAQRFDFLSIGSNDLTQYMLAVDRNNSQVSSLYNVLHPAVLMAMQFVIDNAHSAGKTVSVCGEMAGDPGAVILLIAMGFDSLSMNAAMLPRIKWVVRNFSYAQTKAILREALAQEDPADIRRLLEQALIEAKLGGLIWAGR